ncbi:adenosylcobinamide-phosphate synthase CbiB [Porphyromonas loveana]|uniref:adenosylcobinamide-phosphate synthase CbiB n=2 Tax=Porphyromonas loveana TaxID=1884669 RepID=UPI00359FD735
MILIDFLLIFFPFFPSLCLFFAWLLDRRWGDPEGLPHPIVAFGRMIAFGERLLNRGKYRLPKGGLLAVSYMAIVFFSTALAILSLLFLFYYLFVVGDLFGIVFFFLLTITLYTIVLFYCLAGTTLIREVKMVFAAVDRSLEEGRQQVSRIVGRDTAALSAQEVRTAALETLSENLSDGVVAPMFWFGWLGLPGMITYKMINTLDSMIGYKTERYIRFGRVAAKIDDVANFLPARITALMMLLVSGRLDLLPFVLRYGKKHTSPNSGYPEAALAGILNCRFGGTHDYFGEAISKPYIGETDRVLTYEDMQRAIRINRRVEVLMLLLTMLFHAVLLSFVLSPYL